MEVRLNAAKDWMEKQILKSEKERVVLKGSIRASKADEMPFESDEVFAFIVGYTSGEAPYGLTHEEYDNFPKELT